LIPHDPTLLFTVAGMVPFKPYFLGEEAPPAPRAASSQKCVRAGGKHNDLDDIGRTNRHVSFFEMLGNFSFGDYFKAEAIPWAWEWVTDGLGLDPARLWITVHTSDDEAEQIWRDVVGVPAERIQRLDADNFWQMADTGPCGPCSEIFWDLGADHGAGGGPAAGGEDRYIEIWNLVFMQYDQQPDGTRLALPKPSIDTGAGLERILFVTQGVDSIFDSDLFRPLIAAAEQVTDTRYGGGGEPDVSLRILAEHARTMTFLIADGVVPSNEERGYVLRRIIRRAVRHAYRLGVERSVTPAVAEATIEVMGAAYPEIVRQRDLILDMVEREETRFRATLARGVELLEELVAAGDVGGEDAFFLHDTLGFPIDLTREIAGERDRAVDLEGFDARMKEQRERARAAHDAAAARPGAPVELFREVVDAFGPTDFRGRQEYETRAKVLALIVDGERRREVAPGEQVEIVLDRTPFYAESGGQVGDTGTLEAADGATRVVIHDTQYGLPGTLVLHLGRVDDGPLHEGDEVAARIDGARRDAIRRNHTATHVLHWALRQVLGDHVKQAGSLVAPDRLRFDFSHFSAVTPEQLHEVEARANAEVIGNAAVRHYETTKEHAESIGAIAFFGEKYGDMVRVLEAGEHSVELCGGTHVHALGFIGPIKITSEGSIGSNLRRIEAVTGEGALDRIAEVERRQARTAELLKAAETEIPERVERLLDQVKDLNDEVARLRAQQAAGEATSLAAGAADGVVVVRRDGLAPDDLRRLAAATRDALGSGVVGVVGLGPDGTKAGVAVAVTADLVGRGVSAAAVASSAARALGGGTAKSPELVVGGGPNVAGIADAQLALAEAARAAAAG